jgi:hypothetical protein
MRRRTNFADPDYEPTDEELGELIHEAFAPVLEARDPRLEALRERIRVACGRTPTGA